MVQSLLSNELQEGLTAGKEALKNPAFSQNLNDVVQSAMIQELLNQENPTDVHLDPGTLSGTANDILRRSQASGKTLNRQLLEKHEALKSQEEAVQTSGMQAAGLNPLDAQHQDLTPNQITNQNLLQMETFPNVRNPATEPYFRIVESQDAQEEKAFVPSEDANLSLQEQYETSIEEETVTESYELGCSTTLLGKAFQCTNSLQIQVSPQPFIDLDKTIMATFRGRAYNLLTFYINFNTGAITGGGNSDNYFHLSGSLNHEFGSNARVTLLKNQPYHEDPEWVRHTINTAPSGANGFTASYTAFQPKTGHRHRHNRNTIRGGVLSYRFTEKKRNPPTIISEAWAGDCQALEDLSVLGECQVIKEQCLEGPSIRQFGKDPFLRIERPCWKKRFYYQCQVPQGADDCDSIPPDCQKIGSEFKDFLDQHAVEIHRFRCERVRVETKEVIKNKGHQLVLAGDYQKNNDIGDALAGLNIAEEMLRGFRGEFQSRAGLFFNGKAMQCTAKPKNCCGDKKGFWRRMTGCREEEQQLALQLKSGNCHLVGQYRVKKSMLQKVGHVEKKGYCCFQSKLSRIIQEGARKQLPDLNWGNPDAPLCRALTVAEIQMLDWSQIDFSEIATEIIEKAKNTTLNSQQLSAIQNGLRSHLEHAAQGLKQDYPNTNLGKKQAAENLELQQKIKEEDNKRRLKGGLEGQK